MSLSDETIHACSSCWPLLLADFAGEGLDLGEFANVGHLVLVPPEPPPPLAPLRIVN